MELKVALTQIAKNFLQEKSAFYSYSYESWIYWEDNIYKELKQESDKLININTSEVIG